MAGDAHVSQFDLLRDPCLGVRSRSGGVTTRVRRTLPEVLASLARGEDIEFTGLQSHQEASWHAFLVQAAAMCMHRAGSSDLFRDAHSWEPALVGLAGGREAWCLVVSDLAKPAFMQPPVPEATLRDFDAEPFPDDLDVLVAARNHDVKRSRLARATPEHWVYTLVSVQTSQGYSGRGNYGVLRMNGGLGNRPQVGHAPGLGRAERFIRDVARLVGARAPAAERVGFDASAGIALAWTSPWNGEDSLALSALDPWFIEICRRVRLTVERGVVLGHRRATNAARVAARDETSDSADPWTPVDQANGKSMTLSAAGFGYDRTQELLLGGRFAHGAAGELASTDGDEPWFVASAMVRGQGRTEGLHRRLLRLPRKVGLSLARKAGRDQLRARARERVEAAKVARLNVLGAALCVLVGKSDASKPARSRWMSEFDAAVDAVFFEHLWDTADLDDDAARAAWSSVLVGTPPAVGLARHALREAIESLPMRDADRFRVIADAEACFEGCARKRLPDAFEPAEGRKP